MYCMPTLARVAVAVASACLLVDATAEAKRELDLRVSEPAACGDEWHTSCDAADHSLADIRPSHSVALLQRLAKPQRLEGRLVKAKVLEMPAAAPRMQLPDSAGTLPGRDLLPRLFNMTSPASALSPKDANLLPWRFNSTATASVLSPKDAINLIENVTPALYSTLIDLLSRVDLGPGTSAALDDAGYQEVAAVKDSKQMEFFIRRLISSMGLRVRDQGGLHGIIAFYDGELASQSFDALRAELQNTVLNTEGWVTDQVSGASAPLNQDGYAKVGALRSNREMGEFVRRVVSDLGLKVNSEGDLEGLTQWHSGDKATQSFSDLQGELINASKINITWVGKSHPCPGTGHPSEEELDNIQDNSTTWAAPSRNQTNASREEENSTVGAASPKNHTIASTEEDQHKIQDNSTDSGAVLKNQTVAAGNESHPVAKKSKKKAQPPKPKEVPDAFETSDHNQSRDKEANTTMKEAEKDWEETQNESAPSDIMLRADRDISKLTDLAASAESGALDSDGNPKRSEMKTVATGPHKSAADRSIAAKGAGRSSLGKKRAASKVPAGVLFTANHTGKLRPGGARK